MQLLKLVAALVESGTAAGMKGRDWGIAAAVCLMPYLSRCNNATKLAINYFNVHFNY